MSVAKNFKNGSLQHDGFEWAGAVARIRRSGGTSRVGRRSVLLGLLTSGYANSARKGRAADGRSAGSDRG